jgi:redox-sensing transcriptional repressor
MVDRERVLRLLTYKSILLRFKSLGFIRVFSDNIAEALDISASLVRKDFGIFGISGSQKGGYHIDYILEKINQIIGTDELQKVIIIGVGRIGEALMNYKGFANDGIHILAGFDTDLAKMGSHYEVPVFPMEKMQAYIKENEIKIAIMAVPELVAQHTFELLKDAGIRGILNFTPLKIKSTKSVVVNQVNIEHELANLIYFVNNESKMHKSNLS